MARDYVVASAEELLEAQYANRPKRRPVFDALINAAVDLGEVIIQTRKTNVSLITPRRTFARIKATTRSRIDLGLRVEGQAASERLQPSRIHETTPLQISLTRPDEVDSEVLAWLRRPYEQNGEGSQV